ncbi:hypothetical protein BB050_00553 [Flavobacterium anhuiense]|uniref:Uncharacterized protein n=1 Tax=Flavobacterium anhuiense TaxID=459526 RepID=A0AAC9D173_9FLAO|nr:hypothetical protein [Flavobacterium anhuiense]AOC93707.1 hypothetical protein BB050_00553 [Flavobacterium anhuiense]
MDHKNHHLYKKTEKMKASQIKEKIQELESWLIENPTSPERNLIESDIKKLKNLLDKNYE